MPKDSSGAFHFNTQRAKAADRMGAKPKSGMGMPKAEPMPKMEGMGEEKGGGMHTTLHDHGDGTFHTESHDGMREEHPHIGHALMHMAGMHSEGIHHHAHHDGAGITSHHHTGGPEGVSGPHEHGSTEEAMDHMGKVMNGEEPNADNAETPENANSEEEPMSLGAFA